jgi:3-oxoadipate enol-lactonase
VRELAGPPEAPVVLLLHGWTVSAALNFFPVFDALGRRFDVVALDHRGHGRGIRAPEPFSLEACADDAAAALDVLGIDRVVAVGYSMGGPVAQLLWRRHPDRVAGLVLCATAARFSHNRGEQVYFGGFRALAGAARRAPDATRRAVARRIIARRVDDPWVAGELHAHDPLALVEAGAAIGAFDATAWLGSLDVPAAVVAHELDVVVPAARQLALGRLVPDAELHRVVGGHDAIASEATTYAEVLPRACASVAARAAVQGRPAGRRPVTPI